ncbi:MULTISPECIES: hypothetical protein [Bacillaceae]|uniref:ABC-2 family transporter protein n=1 Tax=Evansella alkalicola TaxID=745819 RepID=A0ABS6K0L2_9BACI|nr:MULTISPECIES: hypothetical protein [Bacillaceae]MBU9723841.1 hypothetical protein [Bacillus alkalicola]
MVKQAFWFAKKELKYHVTAMISTALFVVFVGIIAALHLEDAVHTIFVSDTTTYSRFVLDFLFIGLTPTFGAIFFAKPYLTFRTIKEDPYGKRMAFFRALPIPVKTLALSRTIIMLTTLVTLSIVFYTTITITVQTSFFTILSPEKYIIFILIWFGFALMLAGFNPFVEYGTSGKALFIIPSIVLIPIIITIIVIYQIFDLGIVETVFLAIDKLGWIVAVIAILLGILGSYIWNKLLTKRLLKRDYL